MIERKEEMAVMQVRVLIVDDHHHAREAICEILSYQPSFKVVGVGKNSAEALRLTDEFMPDLILMDINMPDMNGLETTRLIKLKYPVIKIVMITVSDDITHLFEAIKNGAQGYLFKNLSPSTWLEYLETIISDEVPFSRDIAGQILSEFSLLQPYDNDQPLTPREREILGWVAKGLTNREIAFELDISEQTVKNHLKNILQKLHLANRVQLTRYAFENGWVRPE
ncbi:response regulator [Paenibacillus cellulosilyticus]|nr:response regulator transcription factor [Paenibacillus cellulosilyticus]